MADMGPDATAADLARLQGQWRQVAFERDGRSDPPDTHGAPNSITTIVGNKYSVCTVEGDLILEGSFEIDATSEPKTIVWKDLIGPRGYWVMPGIYRLDGDTFAFIGANDGGSVPSEFHTGHGQLMRTFARVHPDQHD